MQIIGVLRKFNLILSQHQKIRIFELVVLMIIGGFLEMCSVSLILPFMNVVINPEQTMENYYVSMICGFIGIDSSRIFLVLLAIVLAVVYLFKNVYLLIEYSIQNRFAYGNMYLMQERLLSNFIRRPYEYFLSINSGEIIRIIGADTAAAFRLLITLLQLFTELVVSGMLIIAVFMITPGVTAAVAAIMAVLIVVINKILKPLLRNAGMENQKASAGMNKWLLQSIQGIKELKVMTKEDFFEKNYNKFGKQYVITVRRNDMLGMVPRLFIEALSMCTMFFIVAVLIYRGMLLEDVVPILSTVALAAIRLLPSVNRITSALAVVSYNEPMLDKLIENLKHISGKNDVTLAMNIDSHAVDVSTGKIGRLQRDIVLKDISYKYPTAETEVLQNTNMTVKKGQSVGIVGASGAGKTTVVDVLLGFLDPGDGQVLIDDVDIKEDMPGFLHQIGYIPQAMFMLDGSIRDNVAFGEDDIDDSQVWRALDDASLSEFVKTLPDGIDTQIGERGMRVSGGQKQRIGIARALYHNPGILVFDEATSALDNETEKAIMESIDHLKGQKTMIIIAHRLTTIENCDVVYQVKEGKIEIRDI